VFQTGPVGKQVNRIYIEDGSGIESEMYLALLVDRGTSRISFVCSTEGGMDIEEVAAATPEKILSFAVDPATGYQAYHGRRVAFSLGLKGQQVKQCVKLIGDLYRCMSEKDASLLEINPLVVTGGGDLICLDAKMNFDSNALYRHDDIAELRDLSEEDPAEVEALLAPLLQADSAWRHSARELTSVLALKQGRRQDALDGLQGLIDDADTPDGVRARASQMLAALGDGG